MIVVLGSINLDLIFPLAALPAPGETVLAPAALMQPGGKGANQAVAAARDGAAVVLAGAVGADALAAGALAGLDGIDTARVARIEGAATGCAAVLVDAAGQNAIAVGSGANRHVRADQIEDGLLGPDTVVVLQMEVPAAEVAALILRAKARGARVVLNLAPWGVLPAAALRAVDVLVVNETEAAALAAAAGIEASATALRAALGGGDGRGGDPRGGDGRDRDGPAVIVTRGAAGLDLASAGGTQTIAAHPVSAVDTTAAGDGFVGVLASALDRGAALPVACRRATVAAALACTRRGSQSSLPTAAEIDAAMAAAPARD